MYFLSRWQAPEEPLGVESHPETRPAVRAPRLSAPLREIRQLALPPHLKFFFMFIVLTDWDLNLCLF